MNNDPINNKPALFQLMAWHQIVNKPMMALFPHIYSSLSLNELG